MLDPVKQTITIANGTTTSAPIDLTAIGSIRLLALSITTPAIPETVNIEISVDGGTTYGRLRSGGVDITISSTTTTAGTPITELVATHLRLVAAVAVAADRVFKIIGTARG